MSNQHSGNMLNSINFEEHDGTLNAKKVSMVSGATIFAVVNTGSAGQASVVVDGIKGNVTLDRGSLTGIVGNVTISDSKTYIGLTTSTLGLGDRYIGLVTSTQVGLVTTVNVGLQTLAPSPNYIGLVSVGGGIIEPRGNITISDSKGFIGLTTAVNAASPAFIGIVTVTNKDRTITGNLTLTDSKGFIGLTTSVIGSAPTIFAVVNTSAAGQSSVVIDTGLNWIGFATVANATAWPDPKGYIGLVTITGALSAAAGNITLDDGSLTGIIGNLTLTDSKGFIGLTTSTLGASPAFIGIVTVTNKDRTITGNLTLTDSKGFIGLTTSVIGSVATIFAVVNTGAAGQASVVIDTGVSFIGIVTVTNKDRNIIGNLTLSDSKGFIGLTTSVLGSSPSVQSFGQFYAVPQSIASGGLGPILLDNFGRQIVGDSKGFIGLVTIGNNPTFVGNVTLDDGSLTGIVGNLTLTDSKGFIGLTTTTLGASPAFVGIVTIANTNTRAIAGNVTLSDAKTYVGLVTATLGAGDRFIGLVTATTRNGGTTKTLIHKNVAFAQASIVTIAVPTNTFYITHLLLNANATTRVNIKSGASYLTGNVSLGINLNPGGGWVENGSPDSPVYIGLAGAAAIVVEKLDLTGTSAQIGGKLIYYDE